MAINTTYLIIGIIAVVVIIIVCVVLLAAGGGAAYYFGKAAEESPVLTGTAALTLGAIGTAGTWAGSGVDKFKILAPTAKWIWNKANAATVDPGKTPVTFKGQYWNATTTDIAAELHIIVDDTATIKLNGASIGEAAGGWDTNDKVLTVTLKPGNSLFEVIATNGGGPAGLIAALVKVSDRSILLVTDEKWKSA